MRDRTLALAAKSALEFGFFLREIGGNEGVVRLLCMRSRAFTERIISVLLESGQAMNRLMITLLTMLISFPLFACQSGGSPETFSWTYHRPSNTGIQGDYCEALLIGADGNPWIGGYDASFEEGGFSKFQHSQNRWQNFSNVDYPVIGHPEKTGISRVSDIAEDEQGNFWMATGRGGLFFSPGLGASSLVRFGDDNSPIPGGWNRGVDVAPDGTVWFASYATTWGAGGVAQLDPATGMWEVHDNMGDGELAVQPQVGGGYLVWSNVGYQALRYDTSLGTWDVIPVELDEPAKIVGSDATDPQGNTWMLKWSNPDLYEMQLDCLRPDGTWLNVPAPPFGIDISELRAKASNLVLVADGNGGCWRFNGSSWEFLGNWEATPYTYGIDQDAAGNVWMCGIGGAARRDVVTGQWQRYRVTNTSQYDFFNRDLTIGSNGTVYATANAGPGVGGLAKFDGTRWTGFNNLSYGLGEPWPFNGDNSDAVYFRLSTNKLLVNPTYEGLYRKDTGGWTDLQVGAETINDMVEDSLGRLWVTFPGSLLVYENNTWRQVSDQGGKRLRVHPRLPGQIWMLGDTSIVKTNGTTTQIWTIEDFPELDPQSDQFKGMVVARDGYVWIGANTVNLPENSTVIRLDPSRNRYRTFRYGVNWIFPGQYVMPVAATPDGRVWFQYDSDYGIDDQGLVAFNGSRMNDFPAPFEGAPQWGGLPHAAILDVEYRGTPDGYQLWMVCASRGIAVLKVKSAKR